MKFGIFPLPTLSYSEILKNLVAINGFKGALKTIKEWILYRAPFICIADPFKGGFIYRSIVQGNLANSLKNKLDKDHSILGTSLDIPLCLQE